jgi:hypothetical protein
LPALLLAMAALAHLRTRFAHGEDDRKLTASFSRIWT